MVPKHRVNKTGFEVQCVTLKRCPCILTMTTILKKLETYYPMHCFSPKYNHIPSEGQTFLNFVQHLRRQSGKKQVLSGKNKRQ